MDCPIGTVRSRIFRAREAIDAELRPLLDNDTAGAHANDDPTPEYRHDRRHCEHLQRAVRRRAARRCRALRAEAPWPRRAWRQACGRWQLLGDVLRGQAPAIAPSDFADRVAPRSRSSRACDRPALQRDGVGCGGGVDAASQHASALARLVGGAALAASVALVALFVARPFAPDAAPACRPRSWPRRPSLRRLHALIRRLSSRDCAEPHRSGTVGQQPRPGRCRARGGRSAAPRRRATLARPEPTRGAARRPAPQPTHRRLPRYRPRRSRSTRRRADDDGQPIPAGAGRSRDAAVATRGAADYPAASAR